MPAAPPSDGGSSPLSSPASHASSLSPVPALDDDDDADAGDLPPPAADNIARPPDDDDEAASGSAPKGKKGGTSKAAAKGKGKRLSTASSSGGGGRAPAKRARTMTTTSRVVKEELLADDGQPESEQQQQPATTPARRSARGSHPAPTHEPRTVVEPPPSAVVAGEAGPGPSSARQATTTTRRRAAAASASAADEQAAPSPPPPPSVAPAAGAIAPAPSPPPAPAPEPTPDAAPAPKPAPAPKKATTGKKGARTSVAPPPPAEAAAPSADAVDGAPAAAAVETGTREAPTATQALSPARAEPGVEWRAGRETCPMCRDAPTIPAGGVSPSKPPPPRPPPADEDVHMADAGGESSTAAGNALGLTDGPLPAPPAAENAVILDSWLSCVKCKRWHHFECIKQLHPDTLPPGLLALGLADDAATAKIDKWFCTLPKCSTGKPTLQKDKERKRASSRAKPQQQPTYAPSDDDPDAPSPVLPSFDLPAGPAMPAPTAGNEKNFHRRVSQWPALYAAYERQGLIKDAGYQRCASAGVVDAWKDEGEWGWRRGGAIVLVENEPGPEGGPAPVEGGEGAAFEHLGGRLPDRKLTVADVARINGPDQEIEVLSVDTQNRSSAVPGTAGDRWTLAHWARYYAHPQPKRLFNIISYEITGTTLGRQLEPPRAVKDISWVDRHWPSASTAALQLPPVQRYLLMSPAGTFTDWHVDMAASSVYYHVVRGEKVFYFIRPTAKHLEAYKTWASTEKQTMEWLGHSADEVYKVVVRPGATAFIPAGWIHAVYTPKDSLVYGGNFVHTLAIPMQLKVCEIEVAHGEDDEHRFPYFMMLCWFVAKDYTAHLASLQKLSSKPAVPTTTTTSGRPFEQLTPAVLEALLALARFLCDWIEKQSLKKLKGTLTARESRQLKSLIPLKDPFALASVQLANEFRGRVLTQLKFLGQEAADAVKDAEAREAELVDGAMQAAAASSSTVAKASQPAGGINGEVKIKGAAGPPATSSTKDGENDADDEGYREAWTEPQITKCRARRRRPDGPASAADEDALYTTETQHQYRYRTTHARDESTTQELVVSTRVKHLTQWSPPSVVQPAPAAESTVPVATAAIVAAPPGPPTASTNGPALTPTSAATSASSTAAAPPASHASHPPADHSSRAPAPTGPPPPILTTGASARPPTSASTSCPPSSLNGVTYPPIVPNGAPSRSYPAPNGHSQAPPPLQRRPSNGAGSSTMARAPSASSSSSGHGGRPISAGPGVDSSLRGWETAPASSSTSQRRPSSHAYSAAGQSSYPPPLQPHYAYQPQPYRPADQPVYSSQAYGQPSYSQPHTSQHGYPQQSSSSHVTYDQYPPPQVPSHLQQGSSHAYNSASGYSQPVYAASSQQQSSRSSHAAGYSSSSSQPYYDGHRHRSGSPPRPHHYPSQVPYNGASSSGSAHHTSHSPYRQLAPLPIPASQRPPASSSNGGGGGSRGNATSGPPSSAPDPRGP